MLASNLLQGCKMEPELKSGTRAFESVIPLRIGIPEYPRVPVCALMNETPVLQVARTTSSGWYFTSDFKAAMRWISGWGCGR